MIAYDADQVSQAVARRAADMKWSPGQTRIVAGICTWHVDHPDARAGYEDGRPDARMRDMLDVVMRETGADRRAVLASFGAAHCLLCDTVPDFRPALYSAWDRDVGGGRGH